LIKENIHQISKVFHKVSPIDKVDLNTLSFLTGGLARSQMLQEPELFAYSKAALLQLYKTKHLAEVNIKAFHPILLYFS
jgi:hypothetical protein